MSIDDLKDEITGVILAGGRAQRMGGQDKGMIQLAHKPMVEHVIDALRLQVTTILVSANRNLDAYSRYGYPVIQDMVGEYFGPLAGMASGMLHANTPFIVTAPCDSPLVPGNLVERLYAAMVAQQAEISVAHDGKRIQPVFALLRCSLLDSVIAYLNAGNRRIDRWYTQHKTALVDFSEHPESFMNINTEEERATLENRLKAS